VLAFLQAIKEEPADDTPRLILADWLEERGDPRGELLRLQVQLARVIPGSRAGQAYREREQKLRRLHQLEWLGKLATLNWTCHRGLLQLTLEAETFLSSTFAKLASTEHWAWVDGVRLTSLSSDALVTSLAGSPLLAGLNLLNLGAATAPASSLRLLVASRHLPNLAVLELYETSFDTEGAVALAASPYLAKLRHLNLDGCRIGNDGALALATSPHLTRLGTLMLRGNRLSRKTLDALASRGVRVIV
jgi:uncharacterized protein (TIGR02996 family)